MEGSKRRFDPTFHGTGNAIKHRETFEFSVVEIAK
jgi:hypothetical protein